MGFKHNSRRSYEFLYAQYLTSTDRCVHQSEQLWFYSEACFSAQKPLLKPREHVRSRWHKLGFGLLSHQEPVQLIVGWRRRTCLRQSCISVPGTTVTLASQALLQCSSNLLSSGSRLKSVWWAADGESDWFVQEGVYQLSGSSRRGGGVVQSYFKTQKISDCPRCIEAKSRLQGIKSMAVRSQQEKCTW